MRILVNIDVPDLEHAIGFYQAAFGLTLNRRLGATGAELLGADAPIYLLEKAAGTPAAGAVRQPRDYARHWTPVHLDVVVDDVDSAVADMREYAALIDNALSVGLGAGDPNQSAMVSEISRQVQP